MKIYNFVVLIEQDEDGLFVARIPDLPGCHTQAKTLGELHKRIKEAAEICLEERKVGKKHISQPKFIGIQQLELKA